MSATGTETSREKNKFLFSIPLWGLKWKGGQIPLFFPFLSLLPFLPAHVVGFACVPCEEGGTSLKDDKAIEPGRSGFGLAVSLATQEI